MFELIVHAPLDLVEPASDALMDELDALSVSVEDADAGTAVEQAVFGEPGHSPPACGWEHSTLRALFESAAAAQRAATLLRAQAWAQPLQLHAISEVVDQDWVRLTQAQFAPLPITPDLWVVPSWHEPPPQARLAIRLDPGLAFGTGTHPTTRMCLRWLARRGQPGPGTGRVLDYGCGSGILAIGAALLGASSVDALDIDPAAVQSARENATRNGVAIQTGPPADAHGLYDLVLANILATPLKLLAPLLAAHVAPGGWLVLAGILERQAPELVAAYAPWLALAVGDTEEGWILMCAQRSAAQPAVA